MRKLRYLILLFLPSICLADEYATTNSGKIVHLKDNGTWVYIERLPAKVVKIVDGDTIKNRIYRVRGKCPPYRNRYPGK